MSVSKSYPKMLNLLGKRVGFCLLRRDFNTKAFSRFTLSSEVKEALQNDQPIVALESTIITHGMPYPANIEMARKTEAIIREKGAVPATIGIIKGNIHVGLSADELEYLATSKEVTKTSRRDFPYLLANKLDGGTTVSGTMVVAHRAGIKVFVTGGIGGVHRGAQKSMDISADLTELSRTPVMVVSAGVKSILDIGLTLEYLETMGVCVATLGNRGANFPAFYSPDSGFSSPNCVRTPLEAARLIKSNMELDLNTGILLGVPIPEDSRGNSDIEGAIQKAVAEVEANNIGGKEITPYILSRLNELTRGESLRANIALVENNAKIGAEVATNLSTLLNSCSYTAAPPARKSMQQGPVVVGGCIFDFVVKVNEDKISLNGSTHLGNLQYSHGGVGRNLADALARLNNHPRLISAVGADNQGSSILKDNGHIDTSLVKVLSEKRTATYTAILDNTGDCKFGVGDMAIHDTITRDFVLSLEDDISSAPLLISDGNIPEDSLDCLLELCGKHSVPMFYEPTCLRKAIKPLSSKFIGSMTYCSPNLNELMSMARTLPGSKDLADIEDINPMTLTQLAELSVRLLDHYGLSVLLLTLSKEGVLLTRRGNLSDPLPTKYKLNKARQGYSRYSSVHYPGTPAQHVVSVSGAGDCLTAGFITGVLQGKQQGQCVAAGMQAAKMSCGVSAAVPTKLSIDQLNWEQNIEAIVIL